VTQVDTYGSDVTTEVVAYRGYFGAQLCAHGGNVPTQVVAYQR
jgi:hypothetical protein